MISSIKRIPSFIPVCSIFSYTEAMISLIVYSVTEYFCPPYSFSRINGSPTALCLVWWVIVYATRPIFSSFAICSMICVLPIPGGPIRSTGRCLTAGISYSPKAFFRRYASTASLISCFARFISKLCSSCLLSSPRPVSFPCIFFCIFILDCFPASFPRFPVWPGHSLCARLSPLTTRRTAQGGTSASL